MALLTVATTWRSTATAFLLMPCARISRPFLRMSSRGNSENGLSPERIIQFQKERSRIQSDDDKHNSFIEHQRAVFDDMADYFASKEATPPEIVPLMRHLAQRILYRSKNKACRLLDIGCGTGALFPFYLQAANDLNVTLNLTGVDLSPKMVDLANARAKRICESEANRKHSIAVNNQEFISMMEETDNNHVEVYDTVVANACFGNFLDTFHLLEAMTTCLKTGGSLFITHPLGAKFVKQLHEEDPSTVPNLLPTIDELQTTPLPLRVMDFEEKDRFGNAIYLASLVKIPQVSFGNAIYLQRESMLPQMIRLRGTVASGYGRGGKKLGFPTANLPESLFKGALKHVATGVYFGWACLEGRNRPYSCYKAAVNVGYSPTFAGTENREKIVEAHLIVDEGETLLDFYNETMRLVLTGFLREEAKFASFSDLAAQIGRDVVNARDALSMEPFSSLRLDPFLASPNDMWVGTSGGDETASWEFQNLQDAIAALRL